MTLVIGRREQIATRIVFLVSGFGMSAWAPLVPFAQQRAGVAEDTLGLLLLCLHAVHNWGMLMRVDMAAIAFGVRRRTSRPHRLQ